jgi:hypothetical protein
MTVPTELRRSVQLALRRIDIDLYAALRIASELAQQRQSEISVEVFLSGIYFWDSRIAYKFIDNYDKLSEMARTFAGQNYERLCRRGIRHLTAQHEVPSYFVSIQVELCEILCRAASLSDEEGEFKVSPNNLMRALCAASAITERLARERGIRLIGSEG